MTLTDERVLKIGLFFFFLSQFCLKSTGTELIYGHLGSGKGPPLPIKSKAELFKYKKKTLFGKNCVCVRS